MKVVFSTLLLLCVSCLTLRAQIDTTRIPPADPSDSSLRPVPGMEDLARRFASARDGAIDPFRIVPVVADFGDTLVPILKQMVFDSNSRGRAIAIYAGTTLAGIGGERAVTALLDIAQTHPDPEVRGFALSNLLKQIPGDTLVAYSMPPKELLHAYVDNLDDTTFVESVHRSLGQLARVGVMRLTGWDMGEPRGKNTQVTIGRASRITTTVGQIRADWWKKTAPRLVWSAIHARYVMK